MASLVADYSSDTESSEDSESSDVVNDKRGNPSLPRPTFGLPKPDFKPGSIDGHSVFVNPFVEADNAKTAILEKHVKMISTDVKTVNGKKICWNYRKNKCRFGHNCKYAHDSDVQVVTDVKDVSAEGKTNESTVNKTSLSDMGQQKISKTGSMKKRSWCKSDVSVSNGNITFSSTPPKIFKQNAGGKK